MAKLARLDDEGNLIPESEVDVVTIRVDGQDVEVPQSAASILEKAEHDLKSRNERALREGRENLANLLAEDTQWFNTHPVELWPQYQPKVNGGKGFIGDPAMPIQQTVQTPEVTASSTQDKAEMQALKDELNATKAQIASIQADMGKTGEMKVIEIRDTFAARFPNADMNAVNDGLRVFYSSNGRHPTAPEIEAIMKSRHEFVTSRITASKITPPPPPVIPEVGGGAPPSISKIKTPRLDDIDGWKNLAHADNVSPG